MTRRTPVQHSVVAAYICRGKVSVSNAVRSHMKALDTYQPAPETLYPIPWWGLVVPVVGVYSKHAIFSWEGEEGATYESASISLRPVMKSMSSGRCMGVRFQSLAPM